jgi:hypothetical protein
VRKGLVKRGFIDWPAARAFAEGIVRDFDVRTPGTHVAARALSGGNLQKFVVGRELSQAPEVVVINQPTWGVDAAAAAAIRQAILDRAAGGAAVVVISQDLDELLEIADRFAALNDRPPDPAAPGGGPDDRRDRADDGRRAWHGGGTPWALSARPGGHFLRRKWQIPLGICGARARGMAPGGRAGRAFCPPGPSRGYWGQGEGVRVPAC